MKDQQIKEYITFYPLQFKRCFNALSQTHCKDFMVNSFNVHVLVFLVLVASLQYRYYCVHLVSYVVQGMLTVDCQ